MDMNVSKFQETVEDRRCWQATVHGVAKSQTRLIERACSLGCFSHVQLFATLWTVAHKTRLFTGFSRQEYWSGLPCPSPGDLPDPGIKPASLKSPALAGRFFTTRTTWEAPRHNL